ncbi:MAG: hypothetical protein AAGC77_06975 [Pseudomonadota bacterium]
MNKALALALFAAAFGLAACSGSREARLSNPAPCPNVIVLADAARVIEFDGEQVLDDVAYSGEIVDARTACRYFGDEPIDASVDIDLAFGLGPKGAFGEKQFTYFVAVTRTNLEVISKKEFAVEVDFDDDRSIVVVNEDIDKIVIPRADGEVAGQNFEIVIGFSLEPSQAIFNRSGKSLKFPNIQ